MKVLIIDLAAPRLSLIHSLLQDVIDCLPSEYTGEHFGHS